MENLLVKIQENYDVIKTRVIKAAENVGRDPNEVLVLAVTKLQTNETIIAAYQAGMRAFGESYVEEALPTMEALDELKEARWEMVGHIQSRKAKLAANAFNRIHSVDSFKLARLLDKHRNPDLGPLEVLLQVNLSGEDSKQGIEATDKKDWNQVLELARAVNSFDNLNLTGLMTMPPLFANPNDNRKYFALLRELRGFLNDQDASLNLHELSMGTSHDFDVAVEEGATIIRLGSVLLGDRILK